MTDCMPRDGGGAICTALDADVRLSRPACFAMCHHASLDFQLLASIHELILLHCTSQPGHHVCDR